MSFAVSGSAAHGCTHSGGVAWIDKVHVNGQVESDGAIASEPDGFVHDGAQAPLVDIAHGEGANAGFFDVRLFHLIHIAQADNDGIARVDDRSVTGEVSEFA